ncbi:hypothetical protein ACSFA3_19015 [Variovorax sp. RHLX14]
MLMNNKCGFGKRTDIHRHSAVAISLPDRPLHHAVVPLVDGNSYRLRQHANVQPTHLGNRDAQQDHNSSETRTRRKSAAKDAAAPTSDQAPPLIQVGEITSANWGEAR